MSNFYLGIYFIETENNNMARNTISWFHIQCNLQKWKFLGHTSTNMVHLTSMSYITVKVNL